MAIESIGRNATSPLDYKPKADEAKMKEKSDAKEITIINTNCKEDHVHTASCSHTSTTQKVNDGTGKGEHIDKLL